MGVPVTVTGSLNVTVTSITSPALYDPSGLVDVTFVTFAGSTSLHNSLPSASVLAEKKSLPPASVNSTGDEG